MYEAIFQHTFGKSCELLQVVEIKWLIASAFAHLKPSLNYEKKVGQNIYWQQL